MSDDAAPISESPAQRRRRLTIVALPLVAALLVAALVLWARAEPARHGGFCARATVQAGRVLRAADGRVRVQYELATQLDAVLELAYVADVDVLIDGAPAELRPDLEAAAEVLPGYRAERATAIAAGREPPAPPEQLRTTLLEFLVAYEQECL